jgi:hypothetical protein
MEAQSVIPCTLLADTDVSEELAAYIFRVKEYGVRDLMTYVYSTYSNRTLVLFQDAGTKILRNIGTYLPNYLTVNSQTAVIIMFTFIFTVK